MVIRFVACVLLVLLCLCAPDGVATIVSEADFRQKAVEESWLAHTSALRSLPEVTAWFHSDGEKFEKIITDDIPKILGHANTETGKFANLSKGVLIRLEKEAATFTNEDWRMLLLLNFVAAAHLGHFGVEAKYIPDDIGVDSVGALLKTEYGDYADKIDASIDETKAYAKIFELYQFIFHMNLIKYTPYCQNYIAPNCKISQPFDLNAKTGAFTIDNVPTTDKSGKTSSNITRLVISGNFQGYILPNFGVVMQLGQNMEILPKQQIFMYACKDEFLQKCCLPANRINGLHNFGSICYFNSLLQMLHASPTFRDIVGKFRAEDEVGNGHGFGRQLFELFKFIEDDANLKTDPEHKQWEDAIHEFRKAAQACQDDMHTNCISEYLKNWNARNVTATYIGMLEALAHDRFFDREEPLLNSAYMWSVNQSYCPGGHTVCSIQRNFFFGVAGGDMFRSLQESVQHYLTPSILPDMYCNESKKIVSATYQTLNVALPRVLIFSIPRSQDKYFRYSETLPLTDCEGIKTYELVSQHISRYWTVNNVEKGHGFTRVRLNNGKWVNVSDEYVSDKGYIVWQNGKMSWVSSSKFAPDAGADFLVYEQR